MPSPTTKAGPTRASHFRFTPDELAEIDALARTMAEPGVPVTRISVLRAALREFKAARLKNPGHLRG